MTTTSKTYGVDMTPRIEAATQSAWEAHEAAEQSACEACEAATQSAWEAYQAAIRAGVISR